MPNSLPILQGRGTGSNPSNRFERFAVEDDFEHVEHDAEYLEGRQRPKTEYFVDNSRSIITTNDSPDVGFSHSLNVYRGCAHGCIYCYARPTHEWIGFSSGLDFETKVMVKPDAPRLLLEALASPKYEPVTLAMSGVTDCYQPVEAKLKLTRGCLQVLSDCGNPVSVITKNHMITRDVDVLVKLAARNAVVAILSVTTLDPDVARKMEPRTSAPRRRLEAIRTLADAGVPVAVMVTPVVPGLTDHELPAIIQAAADAGATSAGYVPVRLPFAVKDLFAEWLAQHFPDRKDKVLNRIRELRGGKLNDSNFNTRMVGEGRWAEQLKMMFDLAKRKAGMVGRSSNLSTASFKRPVLPGAQLSLFGG